MNKNLGGLLFHTKVGIIEGSDFVESIGGSLWSL